MLINVALFCPQGNTVINHFGVILGREGNINTLQTSNTALLSQQGWSCLILKIYSQTEGKVNKEKLGKGE